MGMFSGFMTNTWAVASIVAVVAGWSAIFIVLRGAAFVADAVPQGAFTGAAGGQPDRRQHPDRAGRSLADRRARHRLARPPRPPRRGHRAGAGGDARAWAALFLSFSTAYAPEIYSLLFGEVLGVSTAEIVPVAAVGMACVLAAMAAVYRPLLLSSVMPELAEARGIRAGRMDMLFLVIVALATSMTLPVVGALLIFSLMIGPPAAARSLTARPLLALGLSVLLALGTVWLSIAAAYDTNWPIGFFVGAIGAGCYAAGRGWAAWRRARARVPGMARSGTAGAPATAATVRL